MTNTGSIMFFVGLGILILGCVQNDGPVIEPGRVVTLDKHCKSGRKFMYLDGSGQVNYTSSYQEIPTRFRNAVVVLERRRSKSRRVRLRGEEKRGYLEAKGILAQNPPGELSDDELRREMQELREEQTRHEAGR